MKTIWSTLGRHWLNPDWEVVLSAQLAFTLCTSGAAEQLRPSLQTKASLSLDGACCRYRYAQRATFFLHKICISVQDTKIVPVNIVCRLACPTCAPDIQLEGQHRFFVASLGSLKSRALQAMWRIATVLVLWSLEDLSLPVWACGTFCPFKEDCKKCLTVQWRFIYRS